MQYSEDGLHWATIMEDNNNQLMRTERIFRGNFDTDSVASQPFGQRLEARALRILPLKWQRAIALRLEVLGCFHPYRGIIAGTPYPPTSDTAEERGTAQCGVCPGVQLVDPGSRAEKIMGCPCSDGLYWSGAECVKLQSCICSIGHTRYF